MRKTRIWYETMHEDCKNEYVCQIFDDNGEFVAFVHEKSYEAAVKAVKEIMKGEK